MERRQDRNYFILNKNSDFLRGCLDGFEATDEGVCVRRGAMTTSRMLSRVFDGGEKGIVWHRFKVECEGGMPAGRLLVYASESEHFKRKGEAVHISEWIRNEEIPIKEKLSEFEPYLVLSAEHFGDVLLHEVHGRYLWFYLEVYPRQTAVIIKSIKIYFPCSSWIDTLPDIYRQNDKTGFLERYLGIFQSLYEDMEEKIYEIPKLLNVERSDKADLQWIAQWLDIEESWRWSEQQLRMLIQCGFSLYRRRGSREGIIKFVELFTGEKPILVEWSEYEDIPHDERLFPNDPYTYMVLVREEVLHSEKDKRTLIRIIEDVSPVYMRMELVILKPYVFLDNHTYIGVNSRIGKYQTGTLDGKQTLSLSVLR